MDNEFILSSIEEINYIKKYGEDNFFISYSGGKDSNVLSALVDLALPCNQIPRVYADTGIELTSVRNFVRERGLSHSNYKTLCTNQENARRRGLSI